MSKKRMIIFTSVILSVVVISLGIVKLYQTYALGNYIDTASSATFDVNITKDTSVRIPANGYSNVFYMVSNTSPGTVRYGVAYTTDSAVTVKTFSTSKDPASGMIEENGKKYVKLRLENTSSTVKNIKISTILGYTGGGELLPPNGVTLVTDIYSPTPLAQYITGLYTSGTKTAITNNSINYNIVTTQSLINDRLGGTTTDLNGGNIRYYGASPNNYIYFNCDDYSNQTSDTCELWRIIGVFDGKVKIMRNESIGRFSWDNKGTNSGAESTHGKNNWSDARLMKMLNAGYKSETGGSLYWNRQSGACYSGAKADSTITCDMLSKGLKNDTTRNMIVEVTYSLLGWNDREIYADQIYNYERITGSVYNETTRDKNWTGKIVLPYSSDYGYAVDFNQCNRTLYYYNDSTCSGNNWMKSILGTTSYGWLLTPNVSSSYIVWYVIDGGRVTNSDYICDLMGVTPVLFLNSELSLKEGTDGSSSNPYQIKVS